MHNDLSCMLNMLKFLYTLYVHLHEAACGLHRSLYLMCYFFIHTQFVFVQWEFLKFNVLEGQSALFGVKPWHWSVRVCVYCTFSVEMHLLLEDLLLYGHASVYFN